MSRCGEVANEMQNAGMGDGSKNGVEETNVRLHNEQLRKQDLCKLKEQLL